MACAQHPALRNPNLSTRFRALLAVALGCTRVNDVSKALGISKSAAYNWLTNLHATGLLDRSGDDYTVTSTGLKTIHDTVSQLVSAALILKQFEG